MQCEAYWSSLQPFCASLCLAGGLVHNAEQCADPACLTRPRLLRHQKAAVQREGQT